MKIAAISAFAFSALDQGCGDATTMECLEKHSRDACSKGAGIKEVIATYSKREITRNEDMLKAACFLARYSVVLMRDGYGIPLDRKITFAAVHKNINIGWEYGAVVYYLSKI